MQQNNLKYRTPVPTSNFLFLQLFLVAFLIWSKIYYFIFFNIIILIAYSFDLKYVIFYDDILYLTSGYFNKRKLLKYDSIDEIILYQQRGFYETLRKGKIKFNNKIFTFFYNQSDEWLGIVNFLKNKGIKITYI